MRELLELFQRPQRFHAALFSFAPRGGDDPLGLLERALELAVLDVREWGVDPSSDGAARREAR